MVSSTGRFAFYSPDQYIPCLVQRSSKILVSFVEPPFQAATSAFVPRCLPSWKCPLESGHGRLKAELYESGQTREAAAGIRSVGYLLDSGSPRSVERCGAGALARGRPLAGLPAGGRGRPPRSRGTAPPSRCQSDYLSQADTPHVEFSYSPPL